MSSISMKEPTLTDFGLTAQTLKRAQLVARAGEVFDVCLKNCGAVGGAIGTVVMLAAMIFGFLPPRGVRDVLGFLIGACVISAFAALIATGLIGLPLWMVVHYILDWGGVSKKMRDYLAAKAKYKTEVDRCAADAAKLHAAAIRSEQRKKEEEERLRRLKSKSHAEHWQVMRGYDLERELQFLFQSLGFMVQRKGQAGDEGVDLILMRDARKIAVQSKGWEKPVGPAVIRETLGAKALHSCSEAWVVSVNGATSAATDTALRLGIRVITGESLAQMVRTGRES